MGRVGWVMGIVVVIGLVILGLRLRTERRKA